MQVVEPREVSPDFRPSDDKEKRGKITSFGRKSQSRLRQAMAKIPDSEWMSAFLITLTYPESFPDQSEVYKRDLDVMKKRIAREWPCAAFWVLEFQKREAPHYHFVAFGLDPKRIQAFRDWLARAWFDVVGSGDLKHLKAGTSVELPRTPAKARNYIAKYASKGDQSLSNVHTGRYWGILNRTGIPWAEEIRIDLAPRFASIANRIARKLVRRRVREGQVGRLRRRIIEQCPEFKYWSQAYFCRLFELIPSLERQCLTLDDIRELRCQAKRDAIALGWRMAMTGLRVPARWRMRNNSTTNLFCSADQFAAALSRHPEFELYETANTRTQDSEAVPRSTCESVAPGRKFRTYQLRP